jgi:hypothetical protein
VRIIGVPAGDEAAARSEAADLLQDALTVDGDALAYRAAWLGSPDAWSALGVDRDAEVTPWEVASALLGRNPRTGEQVVAPGFVVREQRDERGGAFGEALGLTVPSFVPGVTTIDLTVPASASLNALWAQAQDDARRGSVASAMITGADAVLAHIQRSVPVVRGRDAADPGELAKGLAAVAIVHGPTYAAGDDSDGRARNGPLRAHLLLVGVESSDGRLRPPDLVAVGAAEPEIAAVIREALTTNLTYLPVPSVRTGTTRSVHWVGREDAWVPDPFDAYRDYFDASTARRLDDAATLMGEQTARRSDAMLRDGLFELAPFEHLDLDLAARSVDLQDRVDAANTARRRALEDALALEVRAGGADAAPELLAELDTRRERVRAMDRKTLELEKEWLDLFNQGPHLRRWMAKHEHAAAEWIAIRREQAIRAQERIPREHATTEPDKADPPTARLAAGEPPPGAKSIGRGDVQAIVDELEAKRARAREVAGELGAAPVIYRQDVSVRDALDDLELIGTRRVELLAERTAPLAEWLKGQPDEWVAARHAELGDPLTGLDRSAARRIVRNEAAQQAARRDRDLAEAWPAQAEKYRHRLDALTQEGDRLREEVFDLDAWMTRDDRVVRALAYKNEHAVRREIGIVQQVERNVRKPRARTLDLIGPRPDPPEPGLSLGEAVQRLNRWDFVAREIEYERIAAETYRGEGLQPPTRRPEAQRHLDEDIDRLRAERGMPPRQQAQEQIIGGPELERF